MLPPLSVPDTITVLRRRYPEGLVCVDCARLLATKRGSYAKSHLTEEQRLAYVCAECLQDKKDSSRQSADIRASFAKSREQASLRRLRPPLVVTARAETHKAESHTFTEACAEAEVGGRLPCGYCLGSHVLKECGYSGHEAGAVLEARKGAKESYSSAYPLIASLRARSTRKYRSPRIGFSPSQPTPRRVSAAQMESLARINMRRKEMANA